MNMLQVGSLSVDGISALSAVAKGLASLYIIELGAPGGDGANQTCVERQELDVGRR